MNDNTDEQKLVDEAKTALLRGIAKAATHNAGESALNMAEAYGILAGLSTDDEKERALVARKYMDARLPGRR